MDPHVESDGRCKGGVDARAANIHCNPSRPGVGQPRNVDLGDVSILEQTGASFVSQEEGVGRRKQMGLV